jgi:hypothetical protein
MLIDLPVWVRRAFSAARLMPYAHASGGDATATMLLYWWNVEVSGALYGPLHCLEISLRNALHDQLRKKYGRPDWWTTAPLNSTGVRLVTEAHQKLLRRGSESTTADDVVAALSFGFWVSLLSSGAAYDRRLWVPTLHRAFPHYSGPRRLLHDNLLSMVYLRNRIMHHEPIHHRDLPKDHEKIYRLLGYISPETAKEAQMMDRVPEVLSRRHDTCGAIRPPRF